MNEPLFPCTNALRTPNPPFWTTKTAVPKFPQNGGSTPTPCLDKAVHAQGGGEEACELLLMDGPDSWASLFGIAVLLSSLDAHWEPHCPKKDFCLLLLHAVACGHLVRPSTRCSKT